jgi:hypothetical protein
LARRRPGEGDVRAKGQNELCLETVNQVNQLAANKNDQVAAKESPPVRLRLEKISN